MKEKIKNHIKKLKLDKKENIISLIVAVALATIFYIDSVSLTGFTLILLTILLLLITSIFMIVAGFIVVKSLVYVSAALVLMIFLGQSYCDIPYRTGEGDNALSILLIVGILYIVFYFFQTLIKSLSGNYRKIKDEKGSTEKITTILSILFFVGFFIWVIYQVVMPIILNLCIYN